MLCDKCGHDIQIGDYPFCRGSVDGHLNARGGITSDDIPGGMYVKNGICWPDGTPRKFYSKSEIKRAAFEAGWTIGGETPKSNARLTEQRLANAERR